MSSELPYMAQAIEAGNGKAAYQIMVKGMAHYAEEFEKAINGAPVIDNVLIVAAMETILAAITENFDENDRRMSDVMKEQMRVVQICTNGFPRS